MNFSIEHNFKEQPFFEIAIKKQNGKRIKDIYHKHTETKQYLKSLNN